MVLVIDCGGLREARGISNYIDNLINGLASHDCDFEIILIVPKGCAHTFEKKHVRVIYANYIIQPIWESVIVPIVSKLNKAKCIHYTGNTGGVLLPFLLKIKTFVTIHDVSYLKPTAEIPLSKSLYQNLGRLYRRINVPFIARKCTAIFTVSSFAKKDIINSTSVNEEKVTISFNSISDIFFSEVELRNKKNEILIVSGNSPQKNLLSTLRCLNSFQKFEGWTILIAGVSGNEIDTAMFQLPSKLLGDVPQEKLLVHYNHASILIMPSLYESFSIPIIEAMSRGVFVIASNRGAVKEIAEKYAALYNPDYCKELHDKLSDIIESINQNQILNRFDQINHAKSFNIEKQTLPVINEYLKHLK